MHGQGNALFIVRNISSSFMMYSHEAESGPKQEQGPGPEQWGTIGISPCPGSGVM